MPERTNARESLRAPAVSAARGILRALEQYTPAWVVCLEIRILYRTTARAFGVPEKKIPLWSAGQALRIRDVRQALRTGFAGQTLRNGYAEQALRDYAAYSARCLMRCKADPGRIYREAYRTGERVRRLTGFTEKADLERLVFYLYRNIGILMDGHLPGEIKVSSCYFSRFYTPEQCALMSYMDSGIIAGILGGGKIEFTERITEGCGGCKAFFVDNA